MQNPHRSLQTDTYLQTYYKACNGRLSKIQYLLRVVLLPVITNIGFLQEVKCKMEEFKGGVSIRLKRSRAFTLPSLRRSAPMILSQVSWFPLTENVFWLLLGIPSLALRILSAIF